MPGAPVKSFQATCPTPGAHSNPASIDVAYWAVWYGGGAQQTDTGERMLLSGSADDIAGDIGALAALGVRHVVLQFLRPTLGESLDLMTRFAEEVIPKVDA